MNTQPVFFKESLLLIDRTDMELNAVKDLLIKLFESIGQFHFSFQLNDFIRKAIQCRRTETVKHVIQCLCDYSYQINYDPNQINWTDCFKFISQLNDIKTCTDSVIKMLDKKIYLPDATMNFIVENLVEKRNYESCFKILARMHDHARIAKLNSKSILKNFLIFDQSEHAFQFLQLLPLDVTATLYTWEDYIQYCCSKDKVKEAREFMKIFFTKTLPNNFNEIAAIYSYFLSSLCRGESRKDVIIGTIDDIVHFKLKVKPAVLKDCLLKLLDEKIDQKQFYTKVDLVKFNLESREFSALLSRLIQLKRKVEVMALIDMIVNENGFSFKLADLNLSSQEMKYVLAAQSTSIRRLLDEKDHMEAQDDDTKSMISFKSDITSIIDRLTFQDPDEDIDMSFDKISTLSGK